MFSEYVDEDLPLPPFREVFAFALRPPVTVGSNKDGRKRSKNPHHHDLDPEKQAKAKKPKESNSEETTG